MVLSDTQRGMAFMLLSTLAFMVMNGVIRHLANDLHPFEISFFRSLFGVLVFAPLFLRGDWRPLRTRRVWGHAGRGAVNAASMLCYFLALKYATLAKVAALSFTAPLFGTLLAFLILREVIRMRRITALVVGFSGMLIIVQPGTGALEFGALLLIASALLSGVAVVLIKQLSTTECAVTITIYTGFVATPVALVAAIPVWITPTLEQVGWLFATGVLGSIGQLAQVRAFAVAEASAVLPLDFFKLIWSAIIGWVFFAEVVEPTTWLGGAVIFAAGVYIAHRERKAGR